MRLTKVLGCKSERQHEKERRDSTFSKESISQVVAIMYLTMNESQSGKV